jgi:hypothetical protein
VQDITVRIRRELRTVKLRAKDTSPRTAVQEGCNTEEETLEDVTSAHNCICECKSDCPIDVFAKCEKSHKILVALPSKHATVPYLHHMRFMLVSVITGYVHIHLL